MYRYYQERLYMGVDPTTDTTDSVCTTVAAKPLDTLIFCDIFFIRERNFMKFSQ